jgi:hypothetical protein
MAVDHRQAFALLWRSMVLAVATARRVNPTGAESVSNAAPPTVLELGLTIDAERRQSVSWLPPLVSDAPVLVVSQARRPVWLPPFALIAGTWH